MSKKDLKSSMEEAKARLGKLRQYIQVLEKSDGKRSEEAVSADTEPAPAAAKTGAQKTKRPSPAAGAAHAQPATTEPKKKPAKPETEPKTAPKPDAAPAEPKKKPAKPETKPETAPKPDAAPAKPEKKPAKPETAPKPDAAPAKPKKKPAARADESGPSEQAKPAKKPDKPAAEPKTTLPTGAKKPSAKTTDKKTQKPKTAKTPKKKTTKKAEASKPNTLEDELAEQLTPEEIDSFQIEKVDMERLTHKVCDLLVRCESDGMFQSDLYKKLKLSARNGARLSLKLERMGMVTRVKLLEKQRWTYKLILKKTPVSTASLEDAPCLVCPVEQRCSLDGEISPRTCVYIEDWVLAELKRTKIK